MVFRRLPSHVLLPDLVILWQALRNWAAVGNNLKTVAGPDLVNPQDTRRPFTMVSIVLAFRMPQDRTDTRIRTKFCSNGMDGSVDLQMTSAPNSLSRSVSWTLPLELTC